MFVYYSAENAPLRFNIQNWHSCIYKLHLGNTGLQFLLVFSFREMKT